jgi:diadenosine tetraphosphate (Ap4A) HIT family hydrolase
MNSQVDCPFCLSNQLLRVEVMYEDDLWYFAAMEEGSINNAGMIITKRHIETPFEINEAEWSRLRELLPKLKQMLDKKDKPQGYNLGWNIYPTGGQNVAHAHLHLLARYDDEPLAGKGIRYSFKQPDNERPA